MDKNKSRSDLLAAGRKKLQQFRKKKDNKGSSSKDSSKLEQQDTEPDTVTADKPSSEGYSTDGVLISHVDGDPQTVGSVASPSIKHSLAAEIDNSAIANEQDMRLAETSMIHHAEVPMHEVGFREDFDCPVQHAEVSGVIASGPSISIDSVEDNKHICNLHSSKFSSQTSFDTVDGQTRIVEQSRGCGEEDELPSQSVSLLQPREDVGANMDTNCSILKQSDQVSSTELEGEKQLPLLGTGDVYDTVLGTASAQTNFKETCYDEGETIKVDAAFVSGAATGLSDYSISNLREKSILQNSPSRIKDLNEERQVHTEDMLDSSLCHTQFVPEDSIAVQFKGHERPLQTTVKIYDGRDTDIEPPNANMTTFLDAQSGTIFSLGQDGRFLDLLERVKEELIIASFSKDLFNLQISEQDELQMEFDNHCYKLNNEISLLHSSLDELCEKNQGFVGELSQCKSEFELVSRAREELRNQLLTAQAEIETISSRANESEISLERSHADVLRLSKDLDDCKHLVTVLEEENERLNGILNSEIEDRKKLEEEKEICIFENEKISSELSRCESLKVALEVENSKLTETLSSVTEAKIKLEEEREHLSRVNELLSVDLDDFKNMVTSQQEETTNLTRSLALVVEDRTKLEEEKKLLFHESEKLTSELLVLHERQSTEQGVRVRLENDLRDALVRLEQLTEENIFLSNSLDIHKSKIEEICSQRLPRQWGSGADGNRTENAEIDWHHRNESQENDSYQIPLKKHVEILSPVILADETPFKVAEQEFFDDSLGFVTLNRHLEEADLILERLEKEIKGLQSDSASSSRSGGKVSAPAVSKLIQAFESKVNFDEHEVETESQLSIDDPYKLSKELVDNLRALLGQVVMDSVNAGILFKGERGHHKVALSTLKELKDQFEALEDHCNDLVGANIDIGVLYESVKLHLHDAGGKICELEILNDSLKQQCLNHKISNGELAERLSGYESGITELHIQLCDLHENSGKMVSLMCNQLDNLQKGALERVMILEEDWCSFSEQLVEITAKLDESLGKSVTSDITICGYDQLPGRIVASIMDATRLIDDLREKLQATGANHEAFKISYEEVNEKYVSLCRRTEFAVGMLQKIYDELHKLYIASCGSFSGSDMDMHIGILDDPLDYSNFETLLKKLEYCITEKLQLESVNSKLHLDLECKTLEFVDFSKRCLDSIGIEKIIKDVQSVLHLEDAERCSDGMPASYLESMVSLLSKKYRETELQLGLSRKESGSLTMKLTEMKESMHDMSTIILAHEYETVALKESLSQAHEALIVSRFEFKDKANELEQSEQRVSAIREKLSIAVAKGKGLIVQRDSLKQSLAQTSSDLEKCLQELQLKDTRLYEMETKLKIYSESGERVEALESELSYIRNSATALRESFLLKDSVLQRIEEILEELDLPEDFHSRDIIEKVDWLAKSTTVDTLPHTDWDQRSSVAGGSGSDANFVVLDGWKDDVQLDASHGDDLRRKYEELQTKFYGLAEQNEMLEQSLMERNSIVQRWEELLERIDVPLHLRSMDPDDKIEWLGQSLSEACHDRDSLNQKVSDLENYCGSMNVNLDESQRKISDIGAELQSLMIEREKLSERLENVNHYNDNLSFRTFENEIGNIILQNELSNAQESLVLTENKMAKLNSLVSSVLQDEDMDDLVSGSSVEFLELMVVKLIENYTAVMGSTANEHDAEKIVDRSMDTHDAGLEDQSILKKELEDALHQLMLMTEERDQYMKTHESFLIEVENLREKREELQELLNQEEQKSASVREKLNVAVRKGKSLVQQRDSLKHAIQEMTAELNNLKSEAKCQENTLASYEQKFKDLSVYSGQVESLQSENLFLKNQLEETQSNLQEKEYNLTSIINTLLQIDVGGNNPIEKLEQIGKLLPYLREAVVFSEEESLKSKRAAELLLAELNEVQERNDDFQEELANASNEIAKLTKDRAIAETSKLDALSKLEELSNLLTKEKKTQSSQFMQLKSGLDQLKGALHEITCLVADTFSKDLDAFYNLEVAMQSFTKPNGAVNVAPFPFMVFDGFKYRDLKDMGEFPALDSWSRSYCDANFDENDASETYNLIGGLLEELTKETWALKEIIDRHSVSLHEQSGSLSKVLGELNRELISQQESVQSLKRDAQQMESIVKDKEMEADILCRNITVLFEVCSTAVKEIDQRKDDLIRSDLVIGNLGRNISPITPNQPLSAGKSHLLSEESVRTIADRLLFLVREFLDLKAETLGCSLKEMKTTMAKMQKEIQEKDIQKERICMELVSQIKEAEATAANYSLDLDASKDQVRELEKKTEQMDNERKVLEQRLRELQDVLSISEELREKVRSLSDLLASKDQEIEALMHALDEEEAQMEGLTNEIKELEKALTQKNVEFESIETSRGKLMKKLSITVTKFDELHHLSESLLTEVEKLQSQLQDRDSEISFLRQEVTRCTNDALVATQSSNRNSEDIHEVLTWFDKVKTQVGLSHIGRDDKENEVHDHKEVLKKKITSALKEIEDLQAVSQAKDELLQAEKNRVEELKRKELQLDLLEDVEDYNQATSVTSEIFQSEPVINKWAVSNTSVTPQVRSLRKGNNDQVAIAIDMDPASSSNRLGDDEDDDKVHGFKSLASSRIVPKFSRRVTDMIDGLWVSCDRALMRQPALRLGIIIYWAILHALLATHVV